MIHGMLPRTRPLYGYKDLVSAAFQPTGNGPRTAAVTDLLRARLGLPYVLLTASGRGALRLLLEADGRPDVVIPSYTCSAVAEAAGLAGCKTVFAEHGAACFNQRVDDIRPHLKPGRAYIATHQYGQTCDIVPVTAACRDGNVVVYEDIAAALGAKIGGRPAGSFGRACFGSFDTTKLVNVPLKGGFVATADRNLFERLEAAEDRLTRRMSAGRKAMLLAQAAVLVTLRNKVVYRMFHTLHFKWRSRMTAENGRLAQHPGAFYTDRFTEWQAAIALPQLQQLDSLIAERQRNYDELRRQLDGLAGVELPPDRNGADWAPIRFPILVRGNKAVFYGRAVEMGLDFGFSFTCLASPLPHHRAQGIARRVLNVPFDSHITPQEIASVKAVLTALDGTPEP
jgi:dTDP-4-amino-4,6-dideoxygalactose transaminase